MVLPTAAPQRRIVVAIHGGTLKLDIAQWPVFGSQDAKYVFVEMFDYCCDLKAADLVGGERLDRELATTVASQYIARHVELHRRVGGGNVPKLLFSDTTVVGEYTSVDGLVRIIQQQFETRG